MNDHSQLEVAYKGLRVSSEDFLWQVWLQRNQPAPSQKECRARKLLEFCQRSRLAGQSRGRKLALLWKSRQQNRVTQLPCNQWRLSVLLLWQSCSQQSLTLQPQSQQSRQRRHQQSH